jgi:hypothetical protein
MTQTSLLANYLTRDELAKQLNKTVRTIDRWRALGTGPRFVNVGKTIYYHRDEADPARWLKNSKSRTA